MPRPKGSKNKRSAVQVGIENVEELISQTMDEIDQLNAELKARKSELKRLVKIQEAQARAAAEKKAEEDKQAILSALESSGKSVEEILNFLK